VNFQHDWTEVSPGTIQLKEIVETHGRGTGRERQHRKKKMKKVAKGKKKGKKTGRRPEQKRGTKAMY
jgi:ribosomal protein L19E